MKHLHHHRKLPWLVLIYRISMHLVSGHSSSPCISALFSARSTVHRPSTTRARQTDSFSGIQKGRGRQSRSRQTPARQHRWFLQEGRRENGGWNYSKAASLFRKLKTVEKLSLCEAITPKWDCFFITNGFRRSCCSLRVKGQ